MASYCVYVQDTSDTISIGCNLDIGNGYECQVYNRQAFSNLPCLSVSACFVKGSAGEIACSHSWGASLSLDINDIQGVCQLLNAYQ